MSRFAAVFFGILSWVPAGWSRADDGIRGLPVYQERLKNGVRVVVCPDPSTRIAAFKVSFDLTCRDEPPGREGIRLFALFSFTYLDPSWRARIEAAGGWWDPPNFYPEVTALDFTLHADEMDLGVEILKEIVESTRREDPRLKGFFDRVKPGVLGQCGHDSAPDLLAQEGYEDPCRMASLQAVRAHAERITEEEFLAFRAMHLVPQRATVAVVGPFEPETLIKRLRTALEGIPPAPEARPPVRLERLLAGRHVAVRCDESLLRVGFPLPQDVPPVEALVLARLLADGVKSRGFPAMTRVDLHLGARLLRLGIDNPGPGALAAVDAEAEALSGRVDAAPLRRAVAALEQDLSRRFTDPYWLSWPLAIQSEPLGWSGSTPWREYERLRRLSPEDAAALARRVFSSADRVIVQSDGPGTEEKVLRAGTVILRVPQVEDGASGPIPRLPPLRTEQADGFIFVEDLRNPRWSFSGLAEHLADGDLVRLKGAFPQEWSGRLSLEGAGDRASVCSTGVGTSEGLAVLARPASDWLSRAAVDPFAWRWAVSGPFRPKNLKLPAGIGQQKDPAVPHEEALAGDLPLLSVPFGDFHDPDNHAAAILFATWVDVGNRQRTSLGPATLDLPSLRLPVRRVDLRWGERDRAGVLFMWTDAKEKAFPDTWLAGGAGVAGMDAATFRSLVARGLLFAQGKIPRSAADNAFMRLQCDVRAIPYDHYDEVRRRIGRMTREAFREKVATFLSKATAPSEKKRR